MTATLFSSNMFLSSSHGTCSLCSRKPDESFHRRTYEISPWHLLVASDGESSVSSPTGETLPGWYFSYSPQHAHSFLLLPIPRSGNSSRSKYGLHHSPTSSPSIQEILFAQPAPVAVNSECPCEVLRLALRSSFDLVEPCFHKCLGLFSPRFSQFQQLLSEPGHIPGLSQVSLGDAKRFVFPAKLQVFLRQFLVQTGMAILL